MASADAATSPERVVSIDVRLDAHDHVALERILRTGGEAGPLFTALMLSTVNGTSAGEVSAADPLLIPA